MDYQFAEQNIEEKITEIQKIQTQQPLQLNDSQPQQHQSFIEQVGREKQQEELKYQEDIINKSKQGQSTSPIINRRQKVKRSPVDFKKKNKKNIKLQQKKNQQAAEIIKQQTEKEQLKKESIRKIILKRAEASKTSSDQFSLNNTPLFALQNQAEQKQISKVNETQQQLPRLSSPKNNTFQARESAKKEFIGDSQRFAEKYEEYVQSLAQKRKKQEEKLKSEQQKQIRIASKLRNSALQFNCEVSKQRGVSLTVQGNRKKTQSIFSDQRDQLELKLHQKIDINLWKKMNNVKEDAKIFIIDGTYPDLRKSLIERG